MTVAEQKAYLLLASIRAGIVNGVRHYDLAGNPLATEEAILAALQADKAITFDETSRVHRTTVEAELAKLVGGKASL